MPSNKVEIIISAKNAASAVFRSLNSATHADPNTPERPCPYRYSFNGQARGTLAAAHLISEPLFRFLSIVSGPIAVLETAVKFGIQFIELRLKIAFCVFHSHHNSRPLDLVARYPPGVGSAKHRMIWGMSAPRPLQPVQDYKAAFLKPAMILNIEHLLKPVSLTSCDVVSPKSRSAAITLFRSLMKGLCFDTARSSSGLKVLLIDNSAPEPP